MKELNIKRNQRGFTLIELMIVIAILGILAAIAIPQLTWHKKKAYDAAAKFDIKSAYTAAQAYFTDYPGGNITDSLLGSYGFKSTDNVLVTIVNSTLDGLMMTSTNSLGTTTYTMDSAGAITN